MKSRVSLIRDFVVFQLAAAFALTAVAAYALELDEVDQELGAQAAAYAADIRQTMSGYTVMSNIGPVESPISIDLANFLLDHPDMTASIVHGHRIAPYRISMKSPREAWADDGEGTKGLITLTQRSDRSRVHYGDGIYKNRILWNVHATSVIKMTMHPVSPNGCGHIRSTFQVYVKIQSTILAGMIKLMRPFVTKVVGRIFAKAFLVGDHVGRLMQKNPEGILSEMRAFPALSADDRSRLDHLADDIRKQAAACGGR